MPEEKDYYKILGVSKEASRKEIKKAYHRLVSQHKGKEEFINELNQAYRILSDKKKKRKYDQSLEGQASKTVSCSQENFLKQEKTTVSQQKWWEIPFYIFWTIVMAFILWEGVYLPYKTNVLIREYTSIVNMRQIPTEQRFKLAKRILEQAIKINSPYTVTDARKRGGWGLLGVLGSTPGIENSTSAKDLYKYVIRQMEIALKEHSFDPQNYYILGQLYTFGGYRFHNLAYYKKAEEIFKRGLKFSPHRTAFATALARTYVFEGKTKTAENLLNKYAYKYDPNSQDTHMLLAYVYFGEKDYKKAEKEFEWLEKHGYSFWKKESDYMRYVALFDKLNNVKKIIAISKKRVKYNASSSRAWFNLAVGYKKIGKLKEAKQAFEKAKKLNPKDYSRFESFFKLPSKQNQTSTQQTSTLVTSTKRK